MKSKDVFSIQHTESLICVNRVSSDNCFLFLDYQEYKDLDEGERDSFQKRTVYARDNARIIIRHHCQGLAINAISAGLSSRE